MSIKTAKRAHILLPQELVGEIDAIVGPRKRSAFLVETARAEIRRRTLLTFLKSDEPAWSDHAHPEFADGSAAWVHGLRQEGQKRLAAVEEHTRKYKAKRDKKY